MGPHLSFRALTFALLVMACTAAAAVPVPGRGTWETELQARDLDRDGIADAFYDTALDVTWLAQASPIGVATWAETTSWLDTFSLGGYTDWRVPDMGGPANGVDWNPTFSWDGDTDDSYSNSRTEMGHLYYITLGNPPPCAPGSGILPGECINPWPAGHVQNTGPFQNLTWTEDYSFWATTSDPMTYGSFDTGGAQIVCDGCGVPSWVLGANFMVVRTGDVLIPAVPEPAPVLLALAGGVVLAVVRRRRRAA